MKTTLELLVLLSEFIDAALPAIDSIGIIFASGVDVEIKGAPTQKQLGLLALAKMHVELSVLQCEIADNLESVSYRKNTKSN